MSERRRASGYAMIAIAASSWGTWPIILEHATMPASLQSAIVMTVLSMAGLPAMLRDRIAVRATMSQWLGIAWLGIGDALNIALFFAAYERTNVAIAVLTHYLTPIFVAVLAPIVVRERPTARTSGAVVLSFIGLVLLLEPWRADLSRSDVVGGLLGAGSAVFYASNVLVNKRLSPVFSGSEMMFFHGLVAVPILFLMVPMDAYAIVTKSALRVVTLGALGPGALAGLLFVWGLRRVPASHASVLTLLEPFVAVVLAAAILGQTLGAVPVIGGILIIAGAIFVISGGPPDRTGDRLASAA